MVPCEVGRFDDGFSRTPCSTHDGFRRNSSLASTRIIFFDAECTLLVPRAPDSADRFWDNPTPERAADLFELEPDLAATLKTLRSSGKALVVVSRHVEPLLRILLREFGIARHFDDVLVGYDKAELIRSYLARWGFAADSALMVGDTPEADILPLKVVGIRALHFARSPAEPGAISRLGSLPAFLSAEMQTPVPIPT